MTDTLGPRGIRGGGRPRTGVGVATMRPGEGVARLLAIPVDRTAMSSNGRSIEATLEEEGLGKQPNVLSLLAQALYAVKRGDDQRALLFFGVSLLALKSSKASLLVQGVIQANQLRERFTRSR